MRIAATRSFVFAVLAALPSSFSFSNIASFPLRRPLALRRNSAFRSTVNTEASERKQTAIDALEKLLKRQKAELEDTELLLKKLQDGDFQENDSSFALASSVLSGVDYGFLSRSEGASMNLQGGFVDGLDSKSEPFERYGPPGNIWLLGTQQFMRNLNAIRGEYSDEKDFELTPKQVALQAKLESLTLNSTAIWEREIAEGPIDAPLVIKVPYLVLCWFLDVVFEGRNVFARFFFLETVARMPYFSYIGMLHFYETLGFWRRSADIKRVHFSEEHNEFNHLLIMESLGGDQRWLVRFLAQHSAIAYFIVLCFLWALSPTLAYKFSELLERHAVNTYGGFLDENEEALKALPPSIAAVNYYALGCYDMLYGEFQTTALSKGEAIRRPGDNMTSLYDVFAAIKADEGDHVATMKACLDPDVAVASPSIEKKVLTALALVGAASYFVATGDFLDVNEAGDLLDSAVDATAAVDDGATGTAFLDAVVAAAAGFGKQLLEDDEEGNVVGLTTDFFEAGGIAAALEAVRQAVLRVIISILEILAALL